MKNMLSTEQEQSNHLLLFAYIMLAARNTLGVVCV